MSTEVGWLIEVRNPTRWWTGYSGNRAIGNTDARWSSDPSRAIRFARKLDAERVIHANPHMIRAGAVATEHCWGLG